MKRLADREQALHNQFQKYGKNAKEWKKKCILLLPHIEKHKIWKKKRFSSLYEYAAKLAGLSRWSVDDALRILRKIEDKPALQKIAIEKGLNRVRPVANIADEETEKFWAEKAKLLPKTALETYVRDFRRQENSQEQYTPSVTLLKNNNQFGTSTKSQPGNVQKNTQKVEMEMGDELIEKLKKLKGKRSWEELMSQLIETHEKSIEKPEPVKAKSRYVPAKIKNYIIHKTNGTCVAPGCTKRGQSLHHTRRFQLDKTHNPDTIVPLCDQHERIAHLGLFENEEHSPTRWQLKAVADKTHPKYQVDEVVQTFRRQEDG